MYLEYKLFNDCEVRAYNNYYEAKEEAKKRNLLLAEYGDCYGSNISYAYWNKSGNRNDDEEIITYYTFTSTGKPTHLTQEEFKRKLGFIY